MTSPIFLASMATIAMLLVGFSIWVSRRTRRRPSVGDSTDDLSIDVGALAVKGPQLDSPLATFYGVPVRIAVLVVAPVGREGRLPPAEFMGKLIEHWLPGVNQVLARDQPVYRRWPGQLSIQGFEHAFFHNLALPGDRGRNTPWCSACGPFRTADQRFLVGVVACAQEANALSQVSVEHEGKWFDVMRVRLD